ncbi:MAG: sulfatase-like hydrolase/transferase [Verrucomicrobiales bacterium]|nr:sulfatase-like hydrolase/transferase [Verrucomicrobiales bacterium]
MADDQAPWALHASGYEQAYTPNMDRLAGQGARFVNAFTPTPVCSPARASLMTSRYGSELGITDWLHPKTEPELGLDAKFVTWPELMQQAGYQTALFGKWHLGLKDDQHPTQRGYDHFMGFRGGGTTPKNPSLEIDGVEGVREGFVVDLVADAAIDWLRAHGKEKPFAVSIHFREPHTAYLPVRDEDWAKVEHLDNPELPEPDYPGLDVERAKKMTREYLASVAAIDRNLGHILAMLEETGLAQNTLLVYTADHGYNMGHHGIWHKGNGHWLLKKEAMPPAIENIPSGQRPNMYDTSVHIPMILRWPGVIAPGTVVTHTISHLDWLPTFAALAGAPVSGDTSVRGRDITPLLKGTATEWDDDFYAEYSTKHQSHTHMRMYRTPEWKLIRDFNNTGRDELYHLAEDPEEKTNLIDDPRPEVKAALAHLHARILEKMKEVGDSVLQLAK